MQQDLKLPSDWDGWTQPDVFTMHEKFTSIDKMSDIPTIGSDSDPDDLMSALAEADRQPQAPRRKGRKRRRTLSTTTLVAGPTSQNHRRWKKKKTKSHQG